MRRNGYVWRKFKIDAVRKFPRYTVRIVEVNSAAAYVVKLYVLSIPVAPEFFRPVHNLAYNNRAYLRIRVRCSLIRSAGRILAHRHKVVCPRALGIPAECHALLRCPEFLLLSITR